MRQSLIVDGKAVSGLHLGRRRGHELTISSAASTAIPILSNDVVFGNTGAVLKYRHERWIVHRVRRVLVVDGIKLLLEQTAFGLHKGKTCSIMKDSMLFKARPDAT